MTEATQSTALVTVDQRAKLALATTERESKLIEAAASTKDIVACADKTGREMVHKAAMGHRALRLDIKNTGEAAREYANKFQKAVIAEAARLTALIEPEETRLLAIRDGFDAEQERIRQAAIAKEQERVLRVEMEMAMYRDIPANSAWGGSAEIAIAIERTSGPIPELEYKGEEEQRMQYYRAGAVAKLEEMKVAAEAREEAERQAAAARAAEEARIKAEREAEAKRQAEARAELERQQAEMAAARAKAEAEAAEQRRKQEEELAAQREQMARERAALEAERAKAAEALREAEAKQAEMDRQREEAQKPSEPAPEVVDTRPVITVELEPADETLAPAPEAPPTLRLGQISERLGLTLTADFLLSLGFAHSGTDKAAKLFHESEFKAICAALIRHISAVSAKA